MKKLGTYICIGLLYSCSGQPPQEQEKDVNDWNPVFESVELPVGAGSFYPRLAADANSGSLLMSWYSKADSLTTQLYTAAYEAGDWSAPEKIAESDNWFVNWADFPNLSAFANGSKAISYLEKSGEGIFSYDVHLKLYQPVKNSWTGSLVPHSDGTETEHGFVSMAPMPGNTLGVIWLDGRKYTQGEEHGSHDHHDGASEMTLRYARINREAEIVEEEELDGRTCDCCQTAMAATGSGLVAVYRDRSAEDVRDISYIRYEDGRWSTSQTLFADNWEIKGCPVNGPAIAADEQEVAVAWFTAAEGVSKVQLIRSHDEGKSWDTPVLIDNQKPIGRVDVCLLPDKSSIVSWMGEGGRLNVKRVSAAGETSGTIKVATVEGSRSSGFPQMEYYRDSLFMSWTQIGSHKALKMAKAPL